MRRDTAAIAALLGATLLSCGTHKEVTYPPTASIRVEARTLARNPIRTPCVPGRACGPIEIDEFPFEDQRDTRLIRESDLNAYGCTPGKDHSGSEVIYSFEVPQRSILVVDLDDSPDDGVDIDLVLMTSLDERSCQVRGNRSIRSVIDPGRYFLAADTFVDSAGTAKAGPYKLAARLDFMPRDACAMRTEALPMRWKECAEGIDCTEVKDKNGESVRHLGLPAVGPVVKEAHLVTVEDAFDDRAWPRSGDQNIEAHYARAQEEFGLEMLLEEPWAPSGEGGSRWGQGSTGKPVPVLEEMWYITMNWKTRPAPGTRMIVMNPLNGRAVVAAAGYETGPGSPTAIAGVSEEIHMMLGTTHRDALMIGFAVEQGLPFGPILCQSP